jgi:hypothetical protein
VGEKPLDGVLRKSCGQGRIRPPSSVSWSTCSNLSPQAAWVRSPGYRFVGGEVLDDRQLIESYIRAQDPFDPDRLAELRHEDWYADWPQTGERIPNHSSDVEINLNYPGYPGHRLRSVEGHGTEWLYLNSVVPGSAGRWVRISGGGDTWFAEVTLTYEDATWLGVAVCQTIGDRISRETIWYCPTDIPVEWRDRWSRSMPDVGSGIHETSGSPGAQKAHERTLDRLYSLLTSGLSPSDVLTENAAVEFPQTSDVVEGYTDISDLYASSPIRLALVHQRWVLGGSAFVELRTTEPAVGAVLHLLHFDGDLISRISDYWAPALEAPSWRAKWVERI